MYKNFNKIVIVSLFLIFALGPSSVSAQISTTGSYADDLVVNLNPLYPKPGESVSINLEMYSADLNSANISWSQNDKLINKGKGLKNFSFTAPSAGKTTKITISVALASGATFSKILNIRPAGLDIMWEANSFVPAFYKGKALFPPQGAVKIMALPQTSGTVSSINPGSNLVYKWTVNDVVMQDSNGYGRNTIYITGPILGKNLDIEILATDPTTNNSALERLVINPYYPSIVFYEDSPLYGIVFEKALQSFDLVGTETNVLAYPYGMSADSLNNVKYIWKVNGKTATETTGPSAIFRKPEGESGSANVSLRVENDSKPLQAGSNNFNINFKND